MAGQLLELPDCFKPKSIDYVRSLLAMGFRRLPVGGMPSAGRLTVNVKRLVSDSVFFGDCQMVLGYFVVSNKPDIHYFGMVFHHAISWSAIELASAE